MNHEVIATRKTFDGITVALWSDGLVTGRTGERVCGVKLPTSCAFRAADDFGLYTWSELPGFIRSVAKAGHVRHVARPTEAQAIEILRTQVRRHVYVRNGVITPVKGR
jgi:hypothetical protein